MDHARGPVRRCDADPDPHDREPASRCGAVSGRRGDVRRFRPNILVDVDEQDGWVEDGWCGRVVRIGDVELVPRQPCVRCTMVTRPQPDLERDLEIYRTIARHHGGTLGVWSTVQRPGTVHVGDTVEVA